MTTAIRVALLAAAIGTASLAPATDVRAGVPPSFDTVRAHYRPSEAWLLDRDRQPLQQMRIDPAVRRLAWVPIEEVSPAFRQAILLSEDRRFFEHAGVDWEGVAAAAWRNLWNERTRGASTVTMQLAALLDPGLARGEGGRSLARKWDQMRAAQSLESRWRKDQILEAYLNLVPFRGEVVGIAALSQAYFGKHPSGLDRREAALAAALVRAPNASPEAVARRACAVLASQDAKPDCAALAVQARATLARPLPIAAQPSDAPHLARRLLRQPGERLVSTLDGRLQRLARDTLRRHLRELAGRNVDDGAVLVLDNARGEVLAWVGGSGELSDAPQVDAVLAPRQAGSTLKPFLYAQAIEGRWLTAASIVEDSPLSLTTAGGLYVPQNYDRTFRGRVSVRTALGASLNVPAVRALVMVGPEAFHQRLRQVGLDSLKENGDYYGYSLALGSAEVSLAMLGNAYRTLANGGRYSPLRFVPHDSPPSPAAQRAAVAGDSERPPAVAPGRASAREPRLPAVRQVFTAAAVHVVVDILADRNARVGTFGLGSSLDTPQWSAVKTGTSKDMRDNWCVGFDDRYTVAVWVGNLSGAPMWDVSGTSGAAPVWQALMIELQRGRRVQPVDAPPGLVRTRVDFDDRLEPAREEFFVAGTELARVRSVEASASDAVRIVYPGHGTVLALDPDIPPAHQGVLFAARLGRQQGLAWTLDGKPYAPAQAAPKWLPWPGRHRLALVDRRGREVDAVEFEVRGAMARRSAVAGRAPGARSRS